MRALRRIVRFVIVAVIARRLQDYLWGDTEQRIAKGQDWYAWVGILLKRIDKLQHVDASNPHWKVEARKRLMQLAALSVALMELVDDDGITPPKGKAWDTSNGW